MELYEVDELLHEMETTEVEMAKTNNRSLSQIQQGEASQLNSVNKNDVRLKGLVAPEQNILSPARRLEFNLHPQILSALNQDKNHDKYPNISLPYCEESLHLDETDKIISDFKTWRQSCYQTLPQKLQGGKDQVNDNCNDHRSAYEKSEKETHNALSNRNFDANQKVILTDSLSAVAANSDNAHLHASSNHTDSNAVSMLNSDFSKAHTPCVRSTTQLESGASQLSQVHRNSHSTSNLLNYTNNDAHLIQNFRVTNRITNDAATNTESSRKPHRLLTLSDFWETDPSKSEEDMLRIKLEEEKFRRDHCEHLIQELQKRLLEQQEKVAVAVRVDNEKNVVITRLQNAWTKLKLRWQVLEAESNDLHLTLKNVKDKHQMEYTELQSQIKRCERELSKALDLAAGYKEKSDTMTKDKLDLLKSHADELENYKSLVQEAESRYTELKNEFNKISEQNQQLGEALKNTQQEVNRERLRGGEVRGEMGVIHKALDACEAELIVLRQEKESLQLKLKEEVNRNRILEQNKVTCLAAIEEAKNSERIAAEEAKSLAAQQERMRIELREVYQKQVDEVVKAKLHEFQSQLDTAESAFQIELESRQRAIAECAARKIKTVLDKHQLEINLLEEKHKEEKRLSEIQLAHAMQQVSMLDAKLNSQHTNKTQLAEQLHSVMQQQWQQALQIISGGSTDNLTPLQRIHAEKFFESKHHMKSKSSPNIGSNIMEPNRLESHSMPVIDVKNFPSSCVSKDRDGNSIFSNSADETPLTSRRDQSKDDLRRYIKMILDVQQPKSNFMRASFTETNESPTPICKEVPKKYYTKKEESFLSEDSSVVWQPSSEVSAPEVTEYISVPQKLSAKGDHHKIKPPWK